MRYRVFIFSLILLITVAYGCFPTYYVEVRSFSPDQLKTQPGRGIEVSVANVVDNRPEAKPKDNIRRVYLIGQHVVEPLPLFSMTGDIELDGQELTKTVADSVKACLVSTGYIVKPATLANPVRVLTTSIEKFWCRHTTQRVGGFEISELSTDLKLLFEITDKRTDEVVWKREIGGATSCYCMGSLVEEHVEKCLKEKFNEAMQEFQSAVSSDEFKNALIEKGVPLEKPTRPNP